ncbi:hypothetical protein K457DRAFT_134314 [Linnemannia elongata AG-77]|uniref:Uncharacterized protein n=1 Tax=Linnemannia elongata AG-77 TaxID=1314771 RepID=A0A197KC61_9FUNG|nr:hypothetical protein K457DRAFT_134314 [Linnemannia elongata AG-77]
MSDEVNQGHMCDHEQKGGDNGKGGRRKKTKSLSYSYFVPMLVLALLFHFSPFNKQQQQQITTEATARQDLNAIGILDGYY